MAEETHMSESCKVPSKRKLGSKRGGSKAKKKPRKMLRLPEGVQSLKPKKIDGRMKKLYRKRAREYNSDNESGSEVGVEEEIENNKHKIDEDMISGYSSEEAGDDGVDGNADNGFSDHDEDGGIQPGITKFTEGCRAFKMAFKSVIKKAVPDDFLGPVLSAHKKLVAEKLAEEEAEKKVKGEAKKEKHLIGEKGHAKPETYLDSHEKFLKGVATKGVVKLFNAVNKAQNAQKGLDPSRFKDAKAIRKRRKEAFFSELGKTKSTAASASVKAQTSKSNVDGEGPAWAPLRDSYMLTTSKLKDWDKKQNMIVADDLGKVSEYSSSEDD